MEELAGVVDDSVTTPGCSEGGLCAVTTWTGVCEGVVEMERRVEPSPGDAGP